MELFQNICRDLTMSAYSSSRRPIVSENYEGERCVARRGRRFCARIYLALVPFFLLFKKFLFKACLPAGRTSLEIL